MRLTRIKIVLLFFAAGLFFSVKGNCNEAEMSVVIKFDISSNYNFWLRLKCDEFSHQIRIFLDDVLINTEIVSDISGFNWILVAENIFLDKGSYKIDIKCDKPIIYFDKLEISLDANYIPEGFGSNDVLSNLSDPQMVLEISLENKGGYITYEDVDNDALIDFIVTGEEYVSVFSNSGNLIWQVNNSGRQHINSEWGFFFRPYDIDNDGYLEVIGPIIQNDSLFLAILNGQNGNIKASIFLQNFPPNFAYESSQIANFDNDSYSKFVTVKLSDSNYPYDNFQIIAFKYLDGLLSVFWIFEKNNAGKGVCHRPIVYDIDQDGKDEVLLGFWALDEDGSVIWEKGATFFDDALHVDALRAGDFLPDNPGIEIAVASGFVIMDANGGVLWRKDLVGPLGSEGQSVVFDEFRTDIPGLELLVALQGPDNDEYLYSANGDFLWFYDGPSEFDASYETTPIQWIGDSQKEVLEQLRGRGRIISMFDEYGKFVGEIDPSFQYGEVHYRIANVIGDYREEIICFNKNFLVVYSNGSVNQFNGENPWNNDEYRKKQYNWVYY